MSKAEPTIQKYMTHQPHSIQAKSTIKDAVGKMDLLNIRHLPVMEGDKLVGIVSDRDIKLATSFVEVNPELVKVKDVCHEHLYLVEPTSLLKDVALEMAKTHCGSALVTQNGHLVGIFTTVDACRALGEVIEQKFHAH